MQIAVTFRHMEANEGVKDYVKEKVEKLEKYIENPREVHVVLSTEKFRHIAELTVIGDGVVLNGQGRDSDLYSAIDQMAEKVERQVRERRGKERRRRTAPAPAVETGEETGGDEEEDVLSAIRRRRVLAKPMSLEEAVAQLRVSDQDILVFMNSDSGQINAVYRRKDGGYEWAEPHPR